MLFCPQVENVLFLIEKVACPPLFLGNAIRARVWENNYSRWQNLTPADNGKA